MSVSNKQRILDFFAAAAANDNETMLEILHPDVTIIEAESLPYGGITQGSKNFVAFSKQVFKTWNNTRVTTERLIAEGDHVVVLATISGESKRSGTPFNMSIAEVWHFDKDQKVTAIKPFYFDTKALADLLA